MNSFVGSKAPLCSRLREYRPLSGGPVASMVWTDFYFVKMSTMEYVTVLLTSLRCWELGWTRLTRDRRR
jgi:hypothetical protein